MRLATWMLSAGLLALSGSAFAGEFKNACSWGLANDKQVQTDCKINATREDGKTYCFSSDKAMDSFMKDPMANLKKAQEVYGRA